MAFKLPAHAARAAHDDDGLRLRDRGGKVLSLPALCRLPCKPPENLLEKPGRETRLPGCPVNLTRFFCRFAPELAGKLQAFGEKARERLVRFLEPAAGV